MSENSGRAVWAFVVFVLGLGVLAVVVYAATPDGDKGRLIDSAKNSWPLVAGLLPMLAGVFGLQKITATHAETKRQTKVIGEIQHQTNGELTKRIHDITSVVVGEALDARGMVPGQRRSTDVPVRSDGPAEA